MSDLNTNSTMSATIESARTVTEECVPVALLHHGRKRPQAGPDGGWHIVDDPHDVERSIKATSRDGVPNIAAVLAPMAGSQVVVVDVDDDDARRYLRPLGLEPDDPVWIDRTGRRGLHVYLFCKNPPKRVVRAGGLKLDLLSSSLAILPPSSTHLDGGGSYEWIGGHSPSEIPLAELAAAPEPLMEFWHAHTGRGDLPGKTVGSEGKAWELLKGTIPAGRRNDALTRVAGWLRLFHPPPVVEELLLVVNDARCKPPLPGDEVRLIARSVGRYSQPGVNGHPKALVPSEWRRDVVDA